MTIQFLEWLEQLIEEKREIQSRHEEKPPLDTEQGFDAEFLKDCP